MAASMKKFTWLEIERMTVVRLKQHLRDAGEIATGNKEVLQLRLWAKLQQPSSVTLDHGLTGTSAESGDTQEDIVYSDLLKTAVNRVWSADLRQLPDLTFHQMYEYLVLRTHKYGAEVLRGTCYKKLKSYQFFREGGLSDIEIAKGLGKLWVKAKVRASMASRKYKAIVVFDEATGNVIQAACECVAG
jgi:hypothetical protein